MFPIFLYFSGNCFDFYAMLNSVNNKYFSNCKKNIRYCWSTLHTKKLVLCHLFKFFRKKKLDINLFFFFQTLLYFFWNLLCVF